MEWLLKSKNDWMQGIGNINMSQNTKNSVTHLNYGVHIGSGSRI